MSDRHLARWGWHPALSTDQRTFGERAADRMKYALATWPALIFMAIFIGGWMVANSHLVGSGHHLDPYPWILLNLMLSTLAGIQCFVLLIANKRGEQIAADLAEHTFRNTELLKELLDQNTRLTEAVHSHVCGAPTPPAEQAAGERVA